MLIKNIAFEVKEDPSSTLHVSIMIMKIFFIINYLILQPVNQTDVSGYSCRFSCFYTN